MLLACEIEDKDKTLRYYSEILASLNTDFFIKNVNSPLSMLQKRVEMNQCKFLNLNQLKKLNKALLETNNLTDDMKLSFIVNLHQLALAQGNNVENIRLLLLAWKIRADIEIAQVIVNLLIAEQQYDKALSFVNNEMCLQKNSNLFINNKNNKTCLLTKEKLAVLMDQPNK